MNPLLFVSALIIGPLIGSLIGDALYMRWMNRPTNVSKSEGRERVEQWCPDCSTEIIPGIPDNHLTWCSRSSDYHQWGSR